MNIFAIIFDSVESRTVFCPDTKIKDQINDCTSDFKDLFQVAYTEDTKAIVVTEFSMNRVFELNINGLVDVFDNLDGFNIIFKQLPDDFRYLIVGGCDDINKANLEKIQLYRNNINFLLLFTSYVIPEKPVDGYDATMYLTGHYKSDLELWENLELIKKDVE